jgi:hypothetical protein
MVVELVSFRPYTSLILARIKQAPANPDLITKILDEIAGMLLDKPGITRTLVARGGPVDDGGLTVGFIHYKEERTPRWSNDRTIRDTINHLVLVCLRRRHAAILLTDPSRGAALTERLDGSSALGLAALQSIESGVLNAAFAEGDARTLWLNGIHRRTSVKADSKILTGVNLRDALDPLGDQSYYFTAARCVAELGARHIPIGVSPRRSGVWTGPSSSWQEFRDTVVGVLAKLEATERAHESDEAPLPVLAPPVPRTAKVQDVRDAFDMSIVAPELGEEIDDPQTRERLERWSYHASFEVTPADGPDLTAAVSLDGEPVGRINVHIDLADPRRVHCEITPDPEPANTEMLNEVTKVCRHRRWLQIRYESGHTVSDGVLYSQHFREAPFLGWKFPNFTGVDISEEKPTKRVKGKKQFDPGALGDTQSLFCWVWNNWPSPVDTGRHQRGWLACDDGAMEIADFIHLDDRSDPKRLSLIHVKGSGSKEADRGISVSDYEVVAGQAVKNLRYLDRMILEQGLDETVRRRIGRLVWHDGKESNRARMNAALRNAGANYSRRVVIVQPRVLQHVRETTQKGEAGTGSVVRLRQLETLLLGAEASCHALGAELFVVGDGTPQSTPAHRQRRPRGRLRKL